MITSGSEIAPDVSHQQGDVPLSLSQFNRLFENSFVRDENSAPNDNVTVIPSQDKVTQQILDLKLMFPGPYR